ncbi:DUF3741-associated sequence motif [Arabidopsis thaliana x Arabidopsis arenosa]|uniref:DUF3741-associated sequence motif n=2 Tax=Arabidopsis TaxID=3701 RepID=A0A8T2E3M4_9BRAS|nr:DUF3741-associated sequence motif [Arabidopsis thaliana x Arabidopsis arenosa]OAO99841.1 TRM20 [Arabidopsis thaliana]CAD5329388.1 unnamed protein product [Arabidopsis thaliana]
MNELRGRKAQKIESPVPGCLGKMVNLFDLGTAVNGNKLLTDKPHLDGSSLSRSRSDVTRMPGPSYKGHSEAELIMSDLRRSASSKLSGTPMKKLIAREMSKEVEHKQSPTNVVAKLMGLETLPQTHQETATQRSKSRSNSHSSLNHSMTSTDNEVQKYQDFSREFKDVYETWQSPQKVSRSRDCSPRKGRYDESTTEKQMALVRQKFSEAKRLVTDDSLHQSKEFQDALEVLSSNKDLFVQFLQESNSFSQQNLSDFHHVPPHSEAKRITVLRPSKAGETEKYVVQGRRNKQVKKLASSSQETGWGNRDLGYPSPYVNRGTEEHTVQPTRIVVLKPSLGKSLDIKAVSSSQSSPRGLHSRGYFDEPEDVETKEVAKEITRQVRENLMGHHRNETQSSSVLSNGYIGDDSSFNKSDNEDLVGNLSDSEIMSPASRHSWDCPNRFDSLFSPSSFSRASFSPESSVCREAKKRLSERWALMSVSGRTQPLKHVSRTSSTLGEMLALTETKVTTESGEGSYEIVPATRVSTSCITSDLSQVEMASDSLNILARSKSVSDVRLNGETSVLGSSKVQAPRELTKTGSLKSSWKVSNLFFFKNNKASKEKRDASQCSSMSQLAAPSPVTLTGKTSEDCVFPIDCLPPVSSEQQSIILGEEEVTTPKPLATGNTSENQDQPSPISVLFPPFEEECASIPECSGSTKHWSSQGDEMSLKSNLIDKSPPIGSIARLLSWDDDSCTDNIAKPAMGVHEEEDWHLFIEMILTAAGFSSGCIVSHDPIMSRWHMPNSPLDPSLRDKYTNPDNNNIKEFIHEGKRRQQRSTRKLIFDRINSIVSETTTTRTGNGSLHFDLVEHVWAQLKDWVSDEPSKRDSGEDMDANSLAAESLVKDEIVGRTWTHSLQVEIDDFGIEIEKRLLQELVEEAVIDLTR